MEQVSNGMSKVKRQTLAMIIQTLSKEDTILTNKFEPLKSHWETYYFYRFSQTDTLLTIHSILMCFCVLIILYLSSHAYVCTGGHQPT